MTRRTMAHGKITASNDAPTTDDELDINRYIRALASFVSGCETPMTVAIQGDWGSGKTSLMQMVRKELADENCHVVTFNTWQYAQFQMGDDLVLALMEHLIERVGRGDEEDSYNVRAMRAGLRQALHSLLGTFGNVALDEIGKTVPFGGIAVKAGREAAGAARSSYLEAQSSNHFSSTFRGRTSAIETLREHLESYIAAALDSSNSERRLIVMIDDLDRLPPQRAVEIMEAIKVFLDVERCVYVLAIDFDVVKEGVRHKFGDQFDERKAIAFFDKIIQVPFHMPVNAYKVNRFLLESLSIDATPRPDGKPDGRDTIVELAKNSVGNNPRSLKRLANTFHLLRGLDTDRSGRKAKANTYTIQLFATLCMQSSMPLYYQEFVARISPLLNEDVDDQQSELSDFFDSQIEGFDPYAERLRKPKHEEDSGEVEYDHQGSTRSSRHQIAPGSLGEQYSLSDPEASSFSKFIESFKQAFAPEGDSDDSLDVRALKDAIIRATITSVGSGTKTVDSQGSMTYGWEAAMERLKKNHEIGKDPIKTVERLVDNLQSNLPAGQFDVSLSSDGKRVLFYVDSDNRTRGTMCEIHMGKSVVGIRFGAHYLDEDSVEEWRKTAEEHFRVSANTRAGFQIILQRVKNLDDGELATLTDLLTEAHRLTRDRFFSGTGVSY